MNMQKDQTMESKGRTQEKSKRDRPQKRWPDNGHQWTGLDVASLNTAIEGRGN